VKVAQRQGRGTGDVLKRFRRKHYKLTRSTAGTRSSWGEYCHRRGAGELDAVAPDVRSKCRVFFFKNTRGNNLMQLPFRARNRPTRPVAVASLAATSGTDEPSTSAAIPTEGKKPGNFRRLKKKLDKLGRRAAWAQASEQGSAWRRTDTVGWKRIALLPQVESLLQLERGRFRFLLPRCTPRISHQTRLGAGAFPAPEQTGVTLVRSWRNEGLARDRPSPLLPRQPRSRTRMPHQRVAGMARRTAELRVCTLSAAEGSFRLILRTEQTVVGA
jgi:hypothetical protein